jgi:hypothetical protein
MARGVGRKNPDVFKTWEHGEVEEWVGERCKEIPEKDGGRQKSVPSGDGEEVLVGNEWYHGEKTVAGGEEQVGGGAETKEAIRGQRKGKSEDFYLVIN